MNPYKNLDTKFFWAPAVAQRHMMDISEVWDPKFKIGRHMKVATYGSCFAQHIGNALKANGFNWYIAEGGPQGVDLNILKQYNYNIFSARTGNIYTVSLLKQWVEWALDNRTVPDEVWIKEGRFYDPFRPNIEPSGFSSEVEMRTSRKLAIDAFRNTLINSNIFVFTLGLTESWINDKNGYEYPMCPGTIAGEFDSIEHKFNNQGFQFIHSTLISVIRKIRSVNPKIKILLTVSPVPLTATMSGNHVLVATMESKSILRTVAGAVQRQFNFVDYFPSYEIINSTPYRGAFFEPNMRSVNAVGVDHVMDLFFKSLHKFSVNVKVINAVSSGFQRESVVKKSGDSANSVDDIVCEEEILSTFGVDL
jgi:hypothetical protein